MKRYKQYYRSVKDERARWKFHGFSDGMKKRRLWKKRVSDCSAGLCKLLVRYKGGRYDKLVRLTKKWRSYDGYETYWLLKERPEFFDRVNLALLTAYRWHVLVTGCQPRFLKFMEARPRESWPFNFKVCYLRLHPEYESEFTGWDRVATEDWPDLERDQPDIYKRHFDPTKKYPDWKQGKDN